MRTIVQLHNLWVWPSFALWLGHVINIASIGHKCNSTCVDHCDSKPSAPFGPPIVLPMLTLQIEKIDPMSLPYCHFDLG